MQQLIGLAGWIIINKLSVKVFLTYISTFGNRANKQRKIKFWFESPLQSCLAIWLWQLTIIMYATTIDEKMITVMMFIENSRIMNSNSNAKPKQIKSQNKISRFKTKIDHYFICAFFQLWIRIYYFKRFKTRWIVYWQLNDCICYC